MRATIDVGIDLGTTNSTIAVAENGRVDVIKNNDNEEITPSVVRLLSSSAVIVGRKAYEHYRVHGEGDAYMGIKRQMGKQDQRYHFAAAGIELGPEDLATEILKSLRADAEAWTGEPMRSAVITVPAAFELAQCSATQRAAQRAGIEHAPLLQEPIAAGLAYGYDRELRDAYFMVYDLGGGTVDVTLLQIRDSRLLVIDHDGHNFLGGRDWDRRLTELIIKRINDQGYEIPAGDHPAASDIRRRLEAQVEEEKIRLSRVERVDVILDGRIGDANGRPIETVVGVSRAEYEELITSDIARSIVLAQSLLDRQNLAPGDVARIVPVGGPTLTPLLRRMLKNQLSIELDTRIDPMTVVARGAALFASGMSLVQGGPKTTGGEVVNLRLSYPSVTDDTQAPLGGRIDASDNPAVAIEFRRTDGGWTSGRLPIIDDAFMTRVMLASGRVSVFDLLCYDNASTRMPVAPDRIAITQGLAAADPPLSRSISVVGYDSRGNEALFRILDKGTALPAVRERAFRTARELQPGVPGEGLLIHVLEGEHARAELNRHVGWLEITSDCIAEPLPAGTPVEVKLRVDTSRGVIASAYIALIDTIVENLLQDAYRPTVDLVDVKEDLDVELRRARDVGSGRAEDVQRIEQAGHDIERDIEAATTGDRDSADRADLALRELKAEVDRLEAETEVVRTSELLCGQRRSTREIVGESGGAEARTRLTLLEAETERALGSGDVARMTAVSQQLNALRWQVITAHPDYWIETFIGLVQNAEERAHDGDDIGVLIVRGREALNDQDIMLVRAVCMDLIRLIPREEQSSSGLPNIGIRGFD